MIAAAFIVHWRGVVRWAGDHQVEHDLIISRALVEIFSDRALARALAFRGGTALHKLVFPAPLRYSDDIDLVQVAPGPIGDLMRVLRGRLDPILGASSFERSPISHTAVYRFRSEIPPTQPLRLKVEINTREHFSVLGQQGRPFRVLEYLKAGRRRVTKRQFVTNLRAKIPRPAFRDDTVPLLPPGVTYDPDAAYERVMRALIDRWPVT